MIVKNFSVIYEIDFAFLDLDSVNTPMGNCA